MSLRLPRLLYVLIECRYRALTPKARLIPLSTNFIDYLRADGIVLPPDDTAEAEIEWYSDAAARTLSSTSHDSNSESDPEDDETDPDPTTAFPETHAAIKAAIADLGGKVAPKLNWSAPKDATWINPTNSMACTSPNEVYLMVKSSDFVTHDLEHWSDGCVDDEEEEEGEEVLSDRGDPPYHLLLRKHIRIAVCVEFRCFVRRRRLVGICQRDPNYYDFLFGMVPLLRQLVQDFFEEKLRGSFPDESYAFDVYVPAPYQRVWLIDINPWCKRTDSLLFSWLELLTMRVPEAMPEKIGGVGLEDSDVPEGVVRLPLRIVSNGAERPLSSQDADTDPDSDAQDEVSEVDGEEEADEEIFVPEFRLINRDDPEAYSFNSPQYSAHKLPADVVEASQSGPGPLREFAEQWKEALAQEKEKERNGGR